MQDPRKNSSIFNFSKGQLKLIKICAIFFLPVILIYTALEISVRQIPNYYSVIGNYMVENAKDIEVATFGSSEIKNSVNPEYLDKKTINLSSTAQHHIIDFTVLKQTRDRFPNLKTVAFEVSYGHFDTPHNSKYYWKNNVFLEYYNVNTFQRQTYWKDHLIFLSYPALFTDLLINYVRNSSKIRYNQWGFEIHHYQGKFKKFNYNLPRILKSHVKINRRADLNVFKHNVAYFYDMMDYCKKENFNVVIMSPPTFSNYNELRNPDILRRRDSILNVITKKYKNVYFINEEKDTLLFKAKDFRNENHLNPDGAKKFTLKLNEVLNEIPE